MKFQVSESVGSGHPDKIADQIADAIVDEAMASDIESFVNCKVIVSANLISIFGFVFTRASLDYWSIVKYVLEPLGYEVNRFNLEVFVKNRKPSFFPDFLSVVGYACDDNSEYIPMSLLIAKQLLIFTEDLIESGQFNWAKYDMKSLVVLKKQSKNFEAKKLIYSVQHSESQSLEAIRNKVLESIVKPLFNKYQIDFDERNLFINSSGKFVIGGLDADSGATNRKIMVDSYGSNAKHGGDGLSGKDLSHVERLGAYYARWICKNLVAARVCRFIELEIIYKDDMSIPYRYELKINDDCEFSKSRIVSAIKQIFPQNTFEVLNIFRSQKHLYSFKDMARRGHIGLVFCGNTSWENLDFVDVLKDHFFN